MATKDDERKVVRDRFGFPSVQTPWLDAVNARIGAGATGSGTGSEAKRETDSNNPNPQSDVLRFQELLADIDYAVGGDRDGEVKIGDQSLPTNPTISGGEAVARENQVFLETYLSTRGGRRWIWLTKEGGYKIRVDDSVDELTRPEEAEAIKIALKLGESAVPARVTWKGYSYRDRKSVV